MTTMDEKYGDGSECIVCDNCGLCITHLDCKYDGCGKEATDYVPTNREKSMRANKNKHWCDCCDASRVGDIGRCSVCGNIAQPHKKKGIQCA